MKKRTVGILLGIVMLAGCFAGCGKNEATEAANESAQMEKEGNGEDEETEKAEEEEKEEKEEEKEDTEEKEKEEETEKAEGASETEKDGEAEEETEEEPEEALKVGVLLPEEEGWERDAESLRTELEENGYEAVIEYAGGDASVQEQQIAELTEQEAAALVIAPADAYGLSEVLAEAKEKSIPVFSYDALIMDTDAVNYYTTFDRRKMGRMIGEQIVKEKDLEKAQKEEQSYNIEFLMGSSDDIRALFLYNGVMEVLQPYLEDGTLVCRSGLTAFDDNGILRWSEDKAEDQLTDILEEFYQDTETLDIVCTGFDGAAVKAAEVFLEAETAPKSEEWPMITGVGCEAEAVKGIAEGKISCSIFMDRRTLAEECVKMLTVYLDGENPEVNDYEQYDNGKKIIGTYACETILINIDDYEALIDNGIYEAEEVQPEEAESTVTPTPEEEEAESTVTPAPEEKETEAAATPAQKTKSL